MHDPSVVAFEVRRPWPKRDRWTAERYRRAGQPVPWFHLDRHGPWWKPGSWSPFVVAFRRGWYFPAALVVWHHEPGGRDSGEVCPHTARWQDSRGKWHAKPLHAWRWHVHHWHVQIPALQHLRRTLLTRCAWCGGRQRRGDAVNVSSQWDAPRTPWWRGESHLYHWNGCSAIEHAHRTCTCATPVLKVLYPGHQPDYGQCVSCGRFRAWSQEPRWTARARWVQQHVPVGARFTPQQQAEWDAMPPVRDDATADA